MADSRSASGFPQQPLLLGGIKYAARPHQLEGNEAAKLLVLRFVNDAHAALAERL